jgi:hypothetical protein
MSFTLTTSVGYQYVTGRPVTLAALRKAASPSVAVTGTVGTSDIAAGAVTAAKSAPDAYWYAAGALGGGVYAVTLSPAATSYITGMEVRFKASAANTAAVDINVNGLGAKNLFKLGGEELDAGDIRSGQDVVCMYDGTNFQVVSAPGNRVTYIVPALDVAGTSNAITLTLRPTPASMTDLVGVGLVFLAEADIAVGGLTINVNTLGAKNVYKNFSQALVASDIKNGQLVEVRYDGTQFQLISATAARTDLPAIRGSYRGFSLAPDGGTPDRAVTGTIKELVLEASTGAVIVLRTLSVFCDVSQIKQLNGRDNTAAGVESASTWYHLWGVSDGTNFATVFSTSSTAPDLSGGVATGYDYYAYLGAVYNDAGSNFVDFVQTDETVQIADTVVLNNSVAGVANVWTLQAFATTVPTTAQRVFGQMGTGGAAAVALIGVSPSGSTKGMRIHASASQATVFNSFYVCCPYEVMLGPTQSFYWTSGNAASQNRITISGWRYSRPYGG